MSAIGISIVEDGKIVEEMFSYVNPEEPFDDFNTQLTGISAETVADAYLELQIGSIPFFCLYVLILISI